MLVVRIISVLTLVTCQNDVLDPYLECPVLELNSVCKERCEAILLDCILQCESEDTLCLSQCIREDTNCIDACPCELLCLEGCTDCKNPVCQCESKETNEEWNRCIDSNGMILGRCVYGCGANSECKDDCVAEFEERQLNCPCEQNCAGGCPCEEFNCVETTTAPDLTTSISTTVSTTTSPTANAVLVLNTYQSANKPLVVDFNGNVNEDINFEYGEGTTAYRGCGVVFKGEYLYFGGYGAANVRQMSKIEGCSLIRQGDLPFNFDRGACNVFNQPQPNVLLCFELTQTQQCHLYDGDNFSSAGSSEFSHYYSFGLANYMGKALTTGSTSNIKTELMDMSTLQWSNGPDYPFASSYIYGYSTASTDDAAFIIGGYDVYETIAEFRNNQWRNLGSLTKGRYYHGSITVGQETMIIGGYSRDSSSLPTEVWTFPDGNHKTIAPTLQYGYYSIGIGLYPVDSNFCR